MCRGHGGWEEVTYTCHWKGMGQIALISITSHLITVLVVALYHRKVWHMLSWGHHGVMWTGSDLTWIRKEWGQIALILLYHMLWSDSCLLASMCPSVITFLCTSSPSLIHSLIPTLRLQRRRKVVHTPWHTDLRSSRGTSIPGMVGSPGQAEAKHLKTRFMLPAVIVCIYTDICKPSYFFGLTLPWQWCEHYWHHMLCIKYCWLWGFWFHVPFINSHVWLHVWKHTILY